MILTEGGVQTLATISSLVGYGVLTSILLIAPFLLAATLVARVAFETSFRHSSAISHPSQPTTLLLLLLAGMVFILPVIQNFSREDASCNCSGNVALRRISRSFSIIFTS